MTELAGPFAVSQPAVSKHLKILQRAGLISVGQDAQRRPRRLEGKPLGEASAWPRTLVYRAYTEPALVRRWLLGPPGWSMPVYQMGVRVDGRFRWRWRSEADGSEFGFSGIFREVQRRRNWVRSSGSLASHVNTTNCSPSRRHDRSCWSAAIQPTARRAGRGGSAARLSRKPSRP